MQGIRVHVNDDEWITTGGQRKGEERIEKEEERNWVTHVSSKQKERKKRSKALATRKEMPTWRLPITSACQSTSRSVDIAAAAVKERCARHILQADVLVRVTHPVGGGGRKNATRV